MTLFIILCCLIPSSIVIIVLWLKNKELHTYKKTTAQQLVALETKLNTLELRNIDAKLNPHLFKNILNSIQSHSYQTYYAIDKLSNVLDYFLYENRKKFVTPKDEIEFTRNLIEINKIKLSPLFELNLKYKVDETDPVYTREVLLPLISVDLIENAFKHADLQSGDSFISITIELKNGQFMMTVSNKISDQQFLKKEKSGLGSQTLESRLNILYKGRYKLEKKVENTIYIAQLKINLVDYNAEMLTTDITHVANQGEFDLLLMGVGQSIFEGSLLGKVLGFTTRIINPEKILNTVTGKEKIFDNSPFDEQSRMIISKSQVPVGIYMDRQLTDPKRVLIPLFNEHDDYLGTSC